MSVRIEAPESQYADLHERYARDGMVPLGRLVSESDVGEIREQVKRYAERVVPTLPEQLKKKMVKYEPDGSVHACYLLHKVDEFFAEFCLQDRMLDIVRAVAGWEPEIYACEWRHKAQNTGFAVPLHQENSWYADDPRPRAHVWLALDEVRSDSGGPVRFWLGYRGDLLPLIRHPDGDYGCDERLATAGAREVYVSAVDAGCATLHDGIIPHDSLPNLSGHERNALFCGYVAQPAAR